MDKDESKQSEGEQAYNLADICPPETLEARTLSDNHNAPRAALSLANQAEGVRQPWPAAERNLPRVICKSYTTFRITNIGIILAIYPCLILGCNTSSAITPETSLNNPQGEAAQKSQAPRTEEKRWTIDARHLDNDNSQKIIEISNDGQIGLPITTTPHTYLPLPYTIKATSFRGHDITERIKFSSSNDAIATAGITPSGAHVLEIGTPGEATITLSSNGREENQYFIRVVVAQRTQTKASRSTKTPPPTTAPAPRTQPKPGKHAYLTNIKISPSMATVQRRKTLKLTAIGLFSDGATMELSNVNWAIDGHGVFQASCRKKLCSGFHVASRSFGIEGHFADRCPVADVTRPT